MARQVDPVTVACVSGALETILKEMTIIMRKTSFSSQLKICKDYSNVLLMGDGRIIAQGEDLPVHMGAMHLTVQNLISCFGEDIQPGDVFYHNDPETGGTHFDDCTMIRPVFHEDDLMFWATCRAHFTDVGAPIAGSYNPHAQDVFSEGLRITPVRIIERGNERKDVLDLIIGNIRYPRIQRADMRAQEATTSIAEKRLLAIIEKYGKGTVRDCCEEILDIRERQVRNWIRNLPDGEYEGKHKIEIPNGELVELGAKVAVHGDEITVTLDSPPQVSYCVNSYKATTIAGVNLSVLKYSGAEHPINEGWLRPIHIDFGPEGTLLNAKHPAAMVMSTTEAMATVCELVNEAMAQIVPLEKLSSGYHHCHLFGYTGIDPRTNEEYNNLIISGSAGGGGAIYGRDGFPGMGPEGGAGVQQRDTSELRELEFPIRITKMELRMDSGGAGKWRGGQGMSHEFMLLDHDAEFYTVGGEMLLPLGVGGAKSTVFEPKASRRWLTTKDGQRKRVPSWITGHWNSGDRIELCPSGGGGVGDPFERDLQAVLDDVIDEKVSIQGAKLDYGVVIDPETLTVDVDETKKIREGTAK